MFERTVISELVWFFHIVSWLNLFSKLNSFVSFSWFFVWSFIATTGIIVIIYYVSKYFLYKLNKFIEDNTYN